MKKLYLLLPVVLFSFHLSFCQQKRIIDSCSGKEGNIDFALISFPLIQRNIIGINFNIVVFPNKFWGTGASLIGSLRKIDSSYQYKTKKPLVSYGEIGWINEFRPLNTRRISAAVFVVNGLSSACLEDGTKRAGKGFKRLTANYYYLLEPGIDVAFKISKNIAIDTKGEYRFIAGYSHFASNRDFSGYIFALGIRIITDTNH